MLLQNCLLPDIRQLCGGEFVFQQDGAPSHRAILTVKFLQQNVPNFLEPSVWPTNSPDINPIDYAVGGALQQDVYRVPIMGLEDLKDKVHTCWASLDQQLIKKAIDQWRPRFKKFMEGTLNSCLLDCLQVLLYEVFTVLLRYILKHVFPFVFHHCDIIQLGCFDSIILFVNNILTYSILIRF